jgi:hypothetical protein
MRHIAVVNSILVALAASCSSQPWAYRPTQATARADAPATVDGHAAARYRLPHGEVEVTTVGVEEVAPPHEAKARAEPMAHVRMVVHNRDREVWTVDPFEQEALLQGAAARRAPHFALCDGNDVAPAVLEPGETRTIDLYYLLPPTTQDAKKRLPQVDVQWRVRTPTKIIAQAESRFEPYEVPRPAIVVPPRHPHQLARAVDEAPPSHQRSDGDALAPTPNDISGGLGR